MSLYFPKPYKPFREELMLKLIFLIMTQKLT